MNRRWQYAQFFELYWWKRYLHGRNKEDYLGWKKAYWFDFLQKSGLLLSSGDQILDAGCGPAGIFTILDQCLVDAVDPLIDRYAVSFPHFRPGDYPNVCFFSQPLESFSPSKRYDIVFCLNAINHVADLDRSLDRLASLIRPGGMLALTVDAHNCNWLRYVFQRVPADILHPHQYTLAEYMQMLAARDILIEPPVLLKKSRIFNYYLLVGRLGSR